MSISSFTEEFYQLHNKKRQEHLASLSLPIDGKIILEVGAGIGDHSQFFIDRGCPMVITDAREQNAEEIGERYQSPNVTVFTLDMDNPDGDSTFRANGGLESKFDVCYNYGLLYHQAKPAESLEWIGKRADMILLETCVSFGEVSELNSIRENVNDLTQSFNGGGCRPTRRWVVDELKKHYNYVYIPKTQPDHVTFPTDWEHPEKHLPKAIRAVFIGSKIKLDNDNLLEEIPMHQERFVDG